MQSKPRPPKPNVYQDAEDEDDDPIWVDFDPKKEEKFNFADRAIPNEDELRKKNKDQQNNWSKPKRDPKIEDKLDEIMLLQMQKDQFDGKDLTELELETGGYSDIDVLYANKLKKEKELARQNKPLNDDDSDDYFADLVEKEERDGLHEMIQEEESENSKDDLLEQAEVITIQMQLEVAKPVVNAVVVEEEPKKVSSIELTKMIKDQI